MSKYDKPRRQGGKGHGRTTNLGIYRREFHRRFPDEAAAQEYLVQARWGGKQHISCPRCGSMGPSTHTTHPSMPYRCRARGCRKYFSVKTGTPLEATKLGCLVWLEAMYLHLTSIDPLSATDLRHELGLSYKSAWFISQRLLEASTWLGSDSPLSEEIGSD